MSYDPQLSADYTKIANSLDIPSEFADEAEFAYTQVAAWLGAEDSALLRYDPDLYPQGSFKLGTPIRPVVKHDEFDIDLVCHLDLRKDQVTQKDLKKLVGDRLKLHAEFASQLVERRRCWTIRFPGRFHLDILPTIPDPAHLSDGVLLTDRDLRLWQHSNPLEYATWFYARMRTRLIEAQQEARRAQATIADIPEWRVRTPLQRAVQILKRHRDTFFQDDLANRPVSIIITTLAGHGYQQQTDLADTLDALVSEMPRHVHRRNNRWEVLNPAHPHENFADKWNETPALRDAFARWIRALERDTDLLKHAASHHERTVLLEQRLGTSAARIAPAGLRSVTVPTRALAPLIRVPLPDDISHRRAATWPADIRYRCDVQTTITRRIRRMNGERPLSRWVHKSAGLRFRAQTDAPHPFQVQWQITNSGAEARGRRQLRGDFYPGEGDDGTIRWEEAQYSGTHFVQAFVLKNGIVVASSDVVRVLVPS